MDVTDAGVVARVLAGDKDAFRVLVERHSRSIFRVAYRMTGNTHDSEEIVQETFLRAYKSLERFELRSNFATWLYRIAVNRSLDFLASRRVEMKNAYQIADSRAPEDSHQMQVPSANPGPDRAVMSGEIKNTVARAMSLLTPPERAAFVMRHMEGRSIEEIGLALNLKAGAAKNCVFRAVQKLRQQLEPFSDPGLGRSRSSVGVQTK